MRSVVFTVFAQLPRFGRNDGGTGSYVDHVTIWRWVQRYAPILDQRLGRERRYLNRSWRVDETYVRVAGNWVYLHRAVDSAGDTIDFMLSPNRDLVAAKHFLQFALHRTGRRPLVMEECLSKLILFGEASLRRALGEFVEHFHWERNHRVKATSCCFRLTM